MLCEQGLDQKLAGTAQHLVARARGCRRGKRSSSASPSRSARSRSASSASTCQLVEAYKSLNEALLHGGIANDCRVEIKHIDSEELEKTGTRVARRSTTASSSRPASARAAPRARSRRSATRARSKVPFFGICFGMQMACIEFARHVCGLDKANSTEIDPATPHPVVDLMPDQRGVTDKGATMRLGAYPVRAQGRHHAPPRRTARPRSASATAIAGRSTTTTATPSSATAWCCRGCRPDGRLVEMIELPQHPYFVACQFHPEFKSRPSAPHPLFSRFIRAAVEHKAGASGSRSRRAPARLSPRPA